MSWKMCHVIVVCKYIVFNDGVSALFHDDALFLIEKIILRNMIIIRLNTDGWKLFFCGILHGEILYGDSIGGDIEYIITIPCIDNGLCIVLTNELYWFINRKAFIIHSLMDKDGLVT